jgi:2-methylisocitrate lyase-like PEP mutase family enzyme
MTPEDFAALHRPGRPFILGNAWNASSARAIEAAGLSAIGTSSAAIAEDLGLCDGNGLEFNDLLPIVRTIRSAVALPVSVDIEAGYSSEPRQVAAHILTLAEMGIVGINIEDSVVDPTRRLRPVEEFANLLQTIRRHLDEASCRLFVNVRTDPYVLGLSNALEETLERARSFAAAGADGLFVPGLAVPEEIEQVVEATGLPVNLMALPGLPSIDELSDLGVARISLGNAIHAMLFRLTQDALQCFQHSGRVDHVF